MANGLFKQLNKQQKEAIEMVKGPSIILAGAGSGKTRALTYKVLNLIENHQVDPKKIIMVTFTNKAAGEMRKRVKRKLGFAGTFHSFCARLLRVDGEKIGLDKNFIIYDESDQRELMGKILKEKKWPERYSPSYIVNKISGAKNQLISSTQYAKLFSQPSARLVAEIYRRYQKELKKNNALDFDDLLFKVVRLLEKDEEILNKYQTRFDYILVDEFQDTNYAQYVLIKLLSDKKKNITVVGDFSQGIYSWRGAEIKNLERFVQHFPGAKTFYLEQNYRSTQKILNFAYQIISLNQTHPILELFTQNKNGEEVVIKQLANEQYEATYVVEEVSRLSQEETYSSVAVLYRINAQSRIIEEAFLHFGIPYILVGGLRFYERREIKDILSYIRLIANPRDQLSKERVIKIGKKRFDQFAVLYKEIKDKKLQMETISIVDQILETTQYLDFFNQDDPEDYTRLENIKELRSVAINFPNLNDFLEQVALVESEYSESEKKRRGENGVYLMTLHQAKGLEFKNVFIVGVEDGILPHSRSSYDIFDLEEERRLFYVGITRAKERLYLTHTKKRFLFGRHTPGQISRFLENVAKV